MAGCGYVCPACEGRGYDEAGNPCDWCADEDAGKEEEKEASDEEN